MSRLSHPAQQTSVLYFRLTEFNATCVIHFCLPLQNLGRACYFDKESGLFFLRLNISKIYVSHEPNCKLCSVVGGTALTV